MSQPKTPASPFVKGLRAAVLGCALGVAALLLSTPLAYRLALLLMASGWDGEGSPVLRVVVGALAMEMGALVVAPAVAFGAGLFLQGFRWYLSTALVLTVQFFTFAVMGLGNGSETLLEPAMAVTALAGTGLGIFLSGAAFGFANRKAQARAQAAQARAASAAAVAQTDFDAVKRALETPQSPAAPEQAPSQAAPAQEQRPPAGQASATAPGSPAAEPPPEASPTPPAAAGQG